MVSSPSVMYHLHRLLVLFLVVVAFEIGEKKQLPVLASDPHDLNAVDSIVTRFDQTYAITWGHDHVTYWDLGTQIELSLDNSSGAGFGSKLHYASGFFHLTMKLPAKDSSGVVTAFYLTSKGDNHDELDFEFLGNKEGKPINLQTNVFANGVGNREQKIQLWFDPTASFHTYKILWNPHQIVFFIDETPIRVFKNKANIGVDYPSRPMQITSSLWNGDSWATDGGQTKIDWTQAPFKAYFKGFTISGCPIYNSNQPCHSSRFWWNRLRALNPTQEAQYQAVKSKYMTYDYCSDRTRHPTPPPECPQ